MIFITTQKCLIPGNLHIIQANMRKLRETTHSFFHDPNFEQASFLLFTEPYVTLDIANSSTFLLLYYTKWQPFFPSYISKPTANRLSQISFHSMIWTAKSQKIQQVPIHHFNITILLLSLLDRSVFLVSVYIPCNTSSSKNKPRLQSWLDFIQKIYLEKKRSILNLELVVSDDFNRWDTLWDGDHLASHSWQGEGRLIIDLISELDLQLLPLRKTITYLGNSRGNESTIDLIMTTNRLFAKWVICQTHRSEYGSDHLAITTKFVIDTPEHPFALRRLYKNARWDLLNNFVKDHLTSIEGIDYATSIEEYTAKLTKVVVERIYLSVPFTKASLYNKRWWTKKLSQLQKRYILFHN